MDRKNKKAAQLNNQSNGNTQTPSDGHKNTNNRRGRGGAAPANGREKDRTGESKPDRFPPKPAGNLTATAPITPSEPSEQPAGDGSQLVSPQQSEATPTTTTAQQDFLPQPPSSDAFPSPTAAQARPTAPKRFSSGRNGSSDLGYGPIGSPPNVNQLSNMRPSYPSNNNNTFSPGTSPPSNHIQPSTSPFAHGEGKQQFFGAYVRGTGERPEQTPIAIQRGPWRPPLVAERNENAVASDEDDYEDFVPSSLNDLLTPEERQRRLSRSGGSRNVMGLGAEGSVGNIGMGAVGSMGSMGMGNHRYSRSVPAARLLEAAQAWKEVDRERDPASISVASLSYRSTGMSDGFSPSHLQLATSNASGAFLHGPHYARNGHIPVNSTTSHLTRQIASQSFEESDVLGAVPTLSTRGGGRYESPYSIQATNRVAALGSDALSPTSRALQSHAPGQSLPQGLAAGLSRLHFAPPGVGGFQNGHKVPGVGNGANEGVGMLGKTAGVRSPLRSQFLGNMASIGTPPESRMPSFGGLPPLPSALSSSPGGVNAMRPSWMQQHQGLMAPPPPKVGTGVGGGLGPSGVSTGTPVKLAHDDQDDLFAFDDLEG